MQPDQHDYILQHIPGSVYVSPYMFTLPVNVCKSIYIPENGVKDIFRCIGLRKDKPAVVYSGMGAFSMCGNHLEQPAIAYTLARFGHNRVYILDGGMEKWNEEKRPLSQEFPSVDYSDFETDVRVEYFVNIEEVKALKERKDVILLDSRPQTAYEEQFLWIKPGHIPGAVNLPWHLLMRESNPKQLRPVGDINAIMKDRGITHEKLIVCSCGSGTKATSVFLVLKYLLKWPKVKLYEGSFTEWSSCPDNPTVSGPDPR